MTDQHVCPAAESGWLVSPVRRLFNNPRRILAGLVHPGDVVIDLGCGPGYFTLPLAGMVGDAGQVIAVDIQREMLGALRLRAEQAGVASRIRLWRSGPEGLGTLGPADFALAFWMVHEVPDRAHFIKEIASKLKPGGLWLISEPKFHVSKANFAQTLELAKSAGLSIAAHPKIFISNAVLLKK